MSCIIIMKENSNLENSKTLKYCIGTTKAGYSCFRLAKNNYNYCHIHGEEE